MSTGLKSNKLLNIRKWKILQRKALFGKLIRLPFLLIPNNLVVPILSGYLKGYKWINSSHNRSVWLGIYERSQTISFVNESKGKNVFWDLGAHVGYYTLLFSKINKNAKTYSFEPSPVNVGYLKRHLKLNSISNVEIFEAAVSNKEGLLKFDPTRTSVAGKLSDHGYEEVQAIKLSLMCDIGNLELPDIIKIDIEGAELDVLQDIREILLQKKPTIFLSTHSQRIHEECLELLNKIGYSLTSLDDKNIKRAREIIGEFKIVDLGQ